MYELAYLAQLLTFAMQAASKVVRRQKQRMQAEPLDPLEAVRQKRAHPLDPFDGDVEMEPAKESKGQRRKRIKRSKAGAPMEVEEDEQAQPREDAEVGHRHSLCDLGRTGADQAVQCSCTPWFPHGVQAGIRS